MKQRDLLLVGTCIVIGFIYRLIPGTPHNFSPIAAMALVGGMYVNRKALAFMMPIIALFASDLILNNTINRVFFTEHTGTVFFADYMIWTYIAFILTVGLGILLFRQKSVSKILVGSLGASLLFFVLSNFGAWLTASIYPKTFAGLLLCFEAGIPFFQNTLMSNLLFVGIFVGSLELLTKRSVEPKIA
jgi:xanthosine utilization system XapX-like protein